MHQQSTHDPMQEMFQKVLTSWAMDALSLRRRGLDRPSSRDGAGLALTRPSRPGDQDRTYTAPQPVITWRRGKAA